MKAKLLLITLALMVATPLMMAPTIHANTAIPGDINGDGHVDILDIVLAGSQYKLLPSDPNYNATIVGKADLAPPLDGVLNILDLTTMIFHWTG